MKNKLILLLIFLASLAISIPLTKPGIYIMHDDQQVARLYLFDKAIKAGQIPPRWVDELGFGFGYPLFNFYPPLVYFTGEVLHIFGFDFINSIKLIFFLGFFLSGIAMYVLVSLIYSKTSALVSAVFYMLAPYRAVDTYIRGALAESFTFVWLPLIIYSFLKLTSTRKSFYSFTSAIFLSLLMITHNLIFLPFAIALTIFLTFLILISDNKLKLGISFILAIAISLALSAFFWIPAILEKKFTIVDQLLLANLADYKIHFLHPQQLWNWPWGFGGSTAGLADGISFKIGKIHILASLAAFVISVLILFRERFKSSLSTARPKRSQRVNCQLSIVFSFLLALSAFMTTYYSKLIWELIPQLGYLQFPWRFLTLTIFFASILAGSLVYFAKVPILKFILIPTLLALLIPNLKLFRPINYRLGLSDQTATAKLYINWEVSNTSFEYLPHGVELYKGPLGSNLVKIQQTDIPKEKVQVLVGSGTIENLQTTPTKISFLAKLDKSSTILVNNFNFPGWELTVDQKKAAIYDNNYLKLITMQLPVGIHDINLSFKNTAVRSLANYISLTFAILSFIFIIIKKWPTRTS